MPQSLHRRVASRLARLLYPHGAVRRVLRGPHHGARFQVINGMGLTYALAQDHWHFGFLAPHLRRGMTVYDLGANCGQMSLFFARLVGSEGRVLAIEPVPSNVQQLKRNLKLNDFDQVTVLEAAAAADHEPKRFCLDAGRHTMGTLETNTSSESPAWWNQVLEVSCLTLDSLLPTYPAPDLLKIDVEGGGGDLIQGALGLLEKHRPAIYMEVHAGTEDAPELNGLRLLRDRFHYSLSCVHDPEGDPLQPAWGAAIWCQPPRPKD